MKIRLLNASHQALLPRRAPAGLPVCPRGGRRSADPAAGPEPSWMQRSPRCSAGCRASISRNTNARLIERFENPAIRDRLSRNAVDASVRIPTFALPSIAGAAGARGSCRPAVFHGGLLVSLPGWERRNRGTRWRSWTGGRLSCKASPAAAERTPGRSSSSGIFSGTGWPALGKFRGGGRPCARQHLREGRPGDPRRPPGP